MFARAIGEARENEHRNVSSHPSAVERTVVCGLRDSVHDDVTLFSVCCTEHTLNLHVTRMSVVVFVMPVKETLVVSCKGIVATIEADMTGVMSQCATQCCRCIGMESCQV